MFNIPDITQGDRLEWFDDFPDLDGGVDTVSCFIRGAGTLNLTAVPSDGRWMFQIAEAQSSALPAGKYQAQFTAFSPGFGRKTLGVKFFNVAADLATVNQPIDNRNSDEIELDKVREAIANALSGGVAEYYIGERRIRYHSLDELYKRERYLVQRVAKRKNKGSIGGRNVGVRF